MNQEQLLGMLKPILASALTYAAAKGWIASDDVAPFIAAAVAIATAGWSFYANRPTAQIAAVNNADNGVKVVSVAATAPQVNVPLKGTGK